MIKRQERPLASPDYSFPALQRALFWEQLPFPLLLTGSISTKTTASMFLGRKSRAQTY